MATVVDALTVTLGLDASGFKTGQDQARANMKATRDAATTTAKEMQASGKQAAEFFSSIKTEALSLLAIFLGGKGIESFVRDTTKSLADLGRTARNIDISPSDLNAFTAAVERMGGSADSAMASLEGIAKAKQQWLTLGNNPEFAAFTGLIGANPNMKPLEIISKFADFAKSAQGQPGGVQRIQQYGEGIGLDRATINSIIQMTKTSTLADQMQRSHELIDINQKMVEHLTTLQTSIVSLEQAFKGMSTALLDKVAPGLTKAIDELTEYLIHPPKGRTPEDIRKELTDPNTFKGTGYLFGPPQPGDVGMGTQWLRQNFPHLFGPSSDKPITPPIGPTQAHANMLEVQKFFQDKGLTQEQIAGILAAGPGAESGFNPNAVGDNGTSGGLFQHHNERWAEMKRRYGPNPTTQQQLEYTWWELTQGPYQNVLSDIRKTPRDPAEVARIWTRGFERPANTEEEAERRARSARRFLVPRTGPIFGPQQPVGIDVPRLPGPRVDGDTSNSVTIGTVNVNTQATDAKGIAKDLHGEIAAQANRGLN